MSIRAIFIAVLTALVLNACCVPIPWSAWRYENTEKFDVFPQPWNLPSPEKYPELYVDGTFIHVLVIAHNETTNSGDSPYQIIVTATAETGEQKSVLFHSIVVTDTKGGNHTYQPIKVNKAANKTGELNFPVTSELKSLNYYNPSPDIESYQNASLHSDYAFNLEPENGARLIVSIDIEGIGGNSTGRKVITYEFTPTKEGGVWQCVRA